jgi:hypothetical protein
MMRASGRRSGLGAKPDGALRGVLRAANCQQGEGMTTTLTYPGVYLSETTSEAHTVTEATTNLTAFLGVFTQGPTNEAVLVNSWAEFQQIYGTLGANSGIASYAVQQFFLNDGIGAWIVRLDGAGSSVAKATTLAPLTINANSRGTWANELVVAFVPSGGTIAPSTTLVDFTVRRTLTTSPETFETLETIPNIPLTTAPAALAAIISGNSTIVAAEAGTGTFAAGRAVLAGGTDAAWTPEAFAKAVEAALEPNVKTPLLDQIAPQVFNIMCIPDMVWCTFEQQTKVFLLAREYCREHQAFLLVDPPPPDTVLTPKVFGGVGGKPPLQITNIGTDHASLKKLIGAEWGEGFINLKSGVAATYYPWVQIPDAANGDQPRLVPPSGTVAGVYAATDTERGVWKAPAGIQASLVGVTGLGDTTITDTINGVLNLLGINVLRTFPLYGNVVWGSRTLAGSNLLDSEFKYVPVRRLTDFIEQSLTQSLRWAVFEPNAPKLWASITLEVTQFMTTLYGAGAFVGASAKEAFSVVCDATTTSLQDQLKGVVNVNVSFQPVDPAEFVVLNLHLGAGVGASS